MKNGICVSILLLSVICQWALAQSTTILPGVVLPQMTNAQRTTLASPQNGMLVFDTDTQSYWFRENGMWTELAKVTAQGNFWQQAGLGGNEIQNTNTGGFWSANPTEIPYYNDDTSNPPTAPVAGAGTRLMWIPSRSAFRVGTVEAQNWDKDAIGLFSFASGYNTTANGKYSTAIGYNTIASGWTSTAMGTYSNATGSRSTAIGRNTTASGDYSTAMGSFVNTNGKEGAFMIGDFSTFRATLSTDLNQMTMRFAGGYRLFTNSIATIGVQLVPNGNSWSTVSDSTKKEKHLAIDGEQLLSKISRFKLTTWNYKGQDPKLFRHYGPMAQDFYAAFGRDGYGVIGNDTLITSADFDGINFAAIQALVKRSEELRVKNEQLEQRIARLEKVEVELAEIRQLLMARKEKEAKESLQK